MTQSNIVHLNPREGLFKPLINVYDQNRVRVAVSVSSPQTTLSSDILKDIFYFCYPKPDNSFGISNAKPVDLTDPRGLQFTKESFRGACGGSGVNYIFYDYFYAVGLRLPNTATNELSIDIGEINKNLTSLVDTSTVSEISNLEPGVTLASVDIWNTGVSSMRHRTFTEKTELQPLNQMLTLQNSQHVSVYSDRNPWQDCIGTFILNPSNTSDLNIHGLNVYSL